MDEWLEEYKDLEPEEVICPICKKKMLDHKDLSLDADGTFQWEHITSEELINPYFI